MKFVIYNASGALEIRDEQIAELPTGAKAATPEFIAAVSALQEPSPVIVAQLFEALP